MSVNGDIEKMDFKQLKNEVQRLRDSLAIMERKFGDIIYNLDNDNFSSNYVKEQGNMKTTVKQTAEKIQTVATRVNEQDEKIVEAESKIEQTADQIKTVVTENITRGPVEEAKSDSDFEDTKKIYVIRGDGENVPDTYYYYNIISGEWEDTQDGNIYSMFEQTKDGFKLRGNVLINGNLFKTVDEGGNEIQISDGAIWLVPDGKDLPKLRIGTREEFDQEGTQIPYILLGAGTQENNVWDVGTLEIYKGKSSAGVLFRASDGLTHGVWFYEADESIGRNTSFMGFGNSVIDFSSVKEIRWGKHAPVAVFGE